MARRLFGRTALWSMLFLFGVSAAFSQGGLVARYTFSGNFKDSSSNHFDAVPFGNAKIVYDSTRQKNVADLDGTVGTYVHLGNDTAFNWHGAWTATFWVYLRSWMGYNWCTFLKKDGAFSFERDISAEQLAFYQWPNFAPTDDPMTPDGHWHYVAATLDGTAQSIYLDGQLYASVQNAGNFLTDTNSVVLGSADGTDRFVNARFDDVRLYNRVLSEKEIDSLGGPAGPVAWYTFENGFADGSGNHLDGIPQGNAPIVYDTDRMSHVLRLDGTTACVDLGNSTLFDWKGAFSAAFWIKVNQWHNSQDAVLRKTGAWTFERNFGTAWLSYYSWPNYVPTSIALSSDSTWHHIAATYDGVTQKLYRDGVLAAEVAKPGGMAVTTNHVYMGSEDGTTNFFDGWLDDVRLYNRVLSLSEIDSLKGLGSYFPGVTSHVMELEGDYQLDVVIAQGKTSGAVRVFFSASHDTSTYAFAQISGDVLSVGRTLSGATSIWKTSTGVGNPPWTIRILKKGSNYRFWVNGATSWIRGPLGEWDGVYEPWKALVGAITPDSGMVQSFAVTTLPWLQQITQPVIPLGPAGSFYEAQVIPGAIIRFGGMYYMYFMGAMTGNQEGAAGRKIGVASSPDLHVWTVQPQPILSYEQLGGQGDNLYPSGAVVTPDGKIALMYAVQLYPTWKGFNLATATDPLGPFQNYSANPVYLFSNTAHEFDLVRTDDSLHRYIILFAGFTTNPPSGPVGDRGYAIYSNDLVHWQEDARNPVFGPSTLDNWDAVHVRPRSLNRIDSTWYLWYEGTNTWTTPNPSYGVWWDGVGLARSQDLVHWEYYPRNPALPALGLTSSQFDNDWVGWPRMIIQGDTGYVFYTGGGQTGMRTIPIAQLTDWTSEGGTVTGVRQNLPGQNPALPNKFSLEQNYPNPFNPTTTIRYALPHRSYVTLSLFNMLGQQVAMLVEADQDAGYHEVRFDGTRLASGVYFYQLRAGGFIDTKKLLLVR